MNDNIQDKVMAFDTLFTNNHIQKLKILISYMDHSMQKTLAIYIKYLELQYTISFFQHYPNALPGYGKSTPDISSLCEDMLPYCSNNEKQQMESMRNMFQTFQSYKDMMEMMQMMKELFPEGGNPMSGDFQAANLLSGLSGMSGMGSIPGMGDFDLSQLFSMFQTMSGTEPETGGDTNGNN